jgi:PAS domain S-box-containing protein
MLIRTRLILIGLLPLLLLMSFIAGETVTQFQLDSYREKVVFADNIGKNFFELFVISQDMSQNRLERPRQQWLSVTQILGSQLPRAKETFSSADENELMETLLEYFENSQHDFQELSQWLDLYKDRTLTTAQQRYLASLIDRLHIDLQSSIPLANRLSALNQEKAVAFDQKRENAMALALVFIAVTLLLFLWPLIRSITRSVNQLKTGMNQVSHGDLELRIENTGKDELAQLAQHFNEMVAMLAEVTVARKILSAEIIERKKVEAELRIAATAFKSQESMIVTDAESVILRVNQAFTETTGYTSEEVVGLTPSILNSGRHNADFYRTMWDTIHRDGIWQGEIWDRRKNGDVFPKLLTISAVMNEDGVVTHYVGSHIDITERKAADEVINSLAFYDPLTHLPNRRLLLDRLQQALASSTRSGREGALLFIDLDNFKTLNDTLGHDMGDLLLQQVAQRRKRPADSPVPISQSVQLI